MKNEDQPQNKVFQILSSIENQHLASSLDTPGIVPIPNDIFLRFMKYVFLTSNIPKEQFWGIETFRQVLLRWERNKLGFRLNVDPYIAGWKEIWNVMMRDEITPDKLLLFLDTLDTWDPMESLLVTNPQRMRLVRDWIHLYIDTQMVPDANSVVRSPILHERVQQWIYKFLPQPLFLHNVTPMTIGPTFTARGYSTNKLPTGRWTSGLKYREETIPPVLAETFHPVAQTEVKAKRGRKPRATNTEETPNKEGTTAPKKVTPTEIHIGSL
jgi:hypothetical protein